MAEEKKLGPNVTYQGQQEEDKTPLNMAGVRFEPGKSVNLEDRLGKEQAQRILKKLAGNRYFKVDGGPDHAAEQKKREELAQKEAEDEQKRSEDQVKQQQEQQRQREHQSALQRAQDEGRAPPPPPPPEDYDGPEQETLEKPTSRRR